MSKKTNPSNPAPTDLPTRNRFDWKSAAAVIRANPGQWHKFDGKPASANTVLIRRGEPKAFQPAGSFDAAVRNGDLYVRFVGEPIEPWLPWEGASFDDLERHPLQIEDEA